MATTAPERQLSAAELTAIHAEFVRSVAEAARRATLQRLGREPITMPDPESLDLYARVQAQLVTDGAA